MIPEYVKTGGVWSVLVASTITLDDMYKVLQVVLLVLAIAMSIQTIARRQRRSKREDQLGELITKARGKCEFAAMNGCPLSEELRRLEKE